MPRFLKAPSINDSYTLPNADGAVGELVQTDGAGQLSFVDPLALNVLSSEHVEIECKNTSGVALSKGDPVYVTGTVGASFRLQIARADASDAQKMPAVGLLQTDLADNAEGYVVVSGVLKNLITSPLSSGDGVPTANQTVYVKPGGGLTKTKPTGTNLIQNVGKLARVSTSADGSLTVASIMRTNDIPNLSTGSVWVGTTGNTAESGVVKLDEVNSRLGINSNGPTQALHVVGNARVTGAFYDSTAGSGSPGTSGQLLSSTGSGTDWIDPPSGSGMDNFIIDADAGLGWPTTITNGETITFQGGTGISTNGSGNTLQIGLDAATATVKGGVELFSNTVQTVAANSVTTTAGKTYGIQLNSAGQAVVNVPWSNFTTDYTDVHHHGTSFKISTPRTAYLSWDHFGDLATLQTASQFINIHAGTLDDLIFLCDSTITSNIQVQLYNNTTQLWTETFTCTANNVVSFTPNQSINAQSKLNMRIIWPSVTPNAQVNITAKYSWTYPS